MPPTGHASWMRLAPRTLRRAYSALTSTRPLLFFSRHVMWKFGPRPPSAHPRPCGRAADLPDRRPREREERTGERRRNAVIYWNDSDRITIAASQAGGPPQPILVLQPPRPTRRHFGGAPMTAVIVDDNDRERLWTLR